VGNGQKSGVRKSLERNHFGEKGADGNNLLFKQVLEEHSAFMEI
jgi:hypothetical protein